ncbi:MAG: hypothetical protein KDB22_29370, partial [Planctomycetales bacterium]|nr:hypothetical protein [Planctomycetales bacterium]
ITNRTSAETLRGSALRVESCRMSKAFFMTMALLIGFIGWPSLVHAADWVIAHDLPGGGVPSAPKREYDMRDEALCQGDAREAASASDRALAKAGWLLWDESVSVGNITVRTAAMGLGGQCRAEGVSVFVYVDDEPVAAFLPSDHNQSLAASVDGVSLTITQTYAKPGEAQCCRNGKHRLQLSLSGLSGFATQP